MELKAYIRRAKNIKEGGLDNPDFVFQVCNTLMDGVFEVGNTFLTKKRTPKQWSRFVP
jgi:hypothetical protein